MSEEKVCPFGLVLVNYVFCFFGFLGVRESKETLKSSMSLSCRVCAVVCKRRELTTNMSDCGRRAPDRLLSSRCHVAMLWAGERFFHFTSSPRWAEGNALQMSGKWRRAQESWRRGTKGVRIEQVNNWMESLPCGRVTRCWYIWAGPSNRDKSRRSMGQDAVKMFNLKSFCLQTAMSI